MAYKSSLEEIRHKHVNRGRAAVVAGCAILVLSASLVFSGCKNEKKKSDDSADNVAAMSPSASEAGLGTVSEPDGSIYNYELVNRLTGLPLDSEELHGRRPAAIMINNIHVACPQVGLRYADTIYECTVEGGITRLMMLVTDYEKLTTVGSIRSCREYYLDFAANHDAIYVHIGGSTEAYTNIYERNIDDLDGMRINMYFRDPNRMSSMGYEHSAMTNGELLKSAVESKAYRTEISEGRETSFKFIPYTEEQNSSADGAAALTVEIPYTSVHKPKYVYDETSQKYLRYQFIGEKHIDGETGEQLSFDNVLIIACRHENRGDSYNHINVYTTGTGNGYYISKGKYIPVTWSKSGVDEPMTLTKEDGSELKMNCGTIFVNIVDDSTLSEITIN